MRSLVCCLLRGLLSHGSLPSEFFVDVAPLFELHVALFSEVGLLL